MYDAAVARHVNDTELQTTPAAVKARLSEADKLLPRDTWDLTSVREWSDAAREPKRAGTWAHAIRMLPLVVTRNSELPDGHPVNAYKGSIVHGGDQVRNDNNIVVGFEAPNIIVDSASCAEQHPAERWHGVLYASHAWVGTHVHRGRGQATQSIAANRVHQIQVPYIIVAYGLVRAHRTRGKGGAMGTPFGNDRGGQGYEQFEKLSSPLWHPKLQLLLLVYVDDFKLTEGTGKLANGWGLSKKHVEMSGQKPVAKVFDCIHREKLAILDGQKVRTVEYDMSASMASCMQLYSDTIMGEPSRNQRP